MHSPPTAHRTDPASAQFEQLQATYYWQNGLYVFNLNDLGGGFIVLVELLIDSSLIQPFADALSAAKPGRGAKAGILLYFITYYVIGQLVLLNVLVAFLLDSFMEAQAADKEGAKEEDEAEASGGTTGAGTASGGGRATEETVSLLGEGGWGVTGEGKGPQRGTLPVRPGGGSGGGSFA